MILRPVDKKGLLLWFVLSLVFTGVIEVVFHLGQFFSALAAVNISTFLVMLIDKVQASQEGRRLSERSLFLMTLLGGSVGMVCAMHLLRHKSRKLSFQLVVWFLVLIQISALFFLFVHLRL